MPGANAPDFVATVAEWAGFWASATLDVMRYPGTNLVLIPFSMAIVAHRVGLWLGLDETTATVLGIVALGIWLVVGVRRVQMDPPAPRS